MTDNGIATPTRAEKLAAFRSPHTIQAVDEPHELFGTIHRCASCGIRVHWITRRYIHDGDEITELLQEEYGGSFGQPKERAIERIAALVDVDEEAEYDREGDPAFNGAFR